MRRLTGGALIGPWDGSFLNLAVHSYCPSWVPILDWSIWSIPSCCLAPWGSCPPPVLVQLNSTSVTPGTQQRNRAGSPSYTVCSGGSTRGAIGSEGEDNRISQRRKEATVTPFHTIEAVIDYDQSLRSNREEALLCGGCTHFVMAVESNRKLIFEARPK